MQPTETSQPAIRPIRVLSADLANKIAAGEVIERPASVVKELVENALDAGATHIEVEVRDGGREYIRVTDNGRGIGHDELPLAFLRHATSKISSPLDLTNVTSLGFRGEALPSIASCSELEITSRAGGDEAARLVVTGGEMQGVGVWAGPPGTTVVVRRLFYNTPARFKFLKQPSTERRYIAEYVSNMALARPEVAFRLQSEGSQLLSTPGSADLLSAIGAVHGVQMARLMVPVQWDSTFATVSGYVSPPDETRPNRSYETLFVNGRWVQNRLLYAAVEKGYQNMLGPRRFPVAVLHLVVDPTMLDVNVHPAKTEVRFRYESETFKAVMLAVKTGLAGVNLAPHMRKTAPEPPAGRVQGTIGLAPPRSVTGTAAIAEIPSRPFGSTAATPAPEQATHDPILSGNVELNSTSAGLAEHIQAPLVEEEIPAQAEAVRDFLSQALVLGQILNTYIAVAAPYGLWLIDQHVAHERILYEAVLKAGDSSITQELLVPVPLQFTPAEAATIADQQQALAAMGFALESFGPGAYLARSVPLQLRGIPDEAALRELLLEVAASFDVSGPTRRERAAAMIACKAAIKAGRRLEQRVQQSLLYRLAGVANPFACPHGRPIMIAIDQEELERRFGRR